MGPQTYPRAGEFTPANIGELIAQKLAQSAANQPNTPEGAASAQSKLGYVNYLNQAVDQWIPTAGLLHQYGMSALNSLSPAMMQAGGPTAYGQMMGQTASQGTMDLGPLRLPIPFAGSAMGSGITSGLSDTFTGLTTPGINPGQVGNIREQLAGLGYGDYANKGLTLPGTPLSTPGVASGMNTLFQHLTESVGPDVGMNPEAMQIADSGIRFDKSSLSDLNQTLGTDLVDAARSANVTFTQMASDMVAFGQWSQQNGGSMVGGARLAQTFARSTGMPASTFLPMMSAPITGSMAMINSGVPPWAIGALQPGQQAAAAMSGFQVAKASVSGMAGATQNIPGYGKV